MSNLHFVQTIDHLIFRHIIVNNKTNMWIRKIFSCIMRSNKYRNASVRKRVCEVINLFLIFRICDINICFKINGSTGRPDTMLNGENVERDIRTIDVSKRVSQVAALPFVRSSLVAMQQAMGKDKGVVMDGRDIGTTVFPDAELKVFVTASPEVRAQRRYDELAAKGMEADFDEILKNVEERDYADSHREVSPLRQADDAIVLDNSHMTIAQQKQWLLDRYREACANKG